MPVTRGSARLKDDQVGEEIEQTLTQTEAIRDLEDMAKQLTKTLKHLLTAHRQLDNDATTIQAGMDELHRMQESRAEHIVERLKNASSTILAFSDVSSEERPEGEGDGDEED
ncbi:uncharacterized protein PHALS_02515 [Plasmopara halstedii]|uniref:Uncharacterized protein n=1 Tax=Plasmopara halstedii TaxID=4781 RepID=A0A0P1A858_PLAHL|nr:uncharacterized protein PHALS_02515 [Plasmopara halstedii]CEG36415.1 hypothetical protein PHALS_02515 [Plasmopara halstedii]|eukprot:XP_024572784.1 hypothetical protein PHALS_02515 [Plasmopara halstedii]